MDDLGPAAAQQDRDQLAQDAQVGRVDAAAGDDQDQLVAVLLALAQEGVEPVDRLALPQPVEVDLGGRRDLALAQAPGEGAGGRGRRALAATAAAGPARLDPQLLQRPGPRRRGDALTSRHCVLR